MSSKSISISEDLKKALEELKAEMSDKRKVTYNELIETLLKSYHAKRMANIENKRLQHTITKIAVNQSKAGTYVTQQTYVPVQANAVAIPPPPPKLHLVPPPQLGEKDDKKAVIRELDALFMENNGIPKLESAEKGRELNTVMRFLDDWVFWK
jgi:hypothetical protein